MGDSSKLGKLDFTPVMDILGVSPKSREQRRLWARETSANQKQVSCPENTFRDSEAVDDVTNRGAGGGESDNAGSVESDGLVDISTITEDPELQCRADIDEAKVAEYAERIKAGDIFPPVTLFKVGVLILLIDGWHRLLAAKRCGQTKISAKVLIGTRQEAVKHAISANLVHGLPRSNQDKRRAVQVALREFPGDSDYVIAGYAKVSHTHVANVRKELATDASSAQRTGRDGKKRRLPRPRTVTENASPTPGVGSGRKANKADIGADGAKEPSKGRPRSRERLESNNESAHEEHPDTPKSKPAAKTAFPSHRLDPNDLWNEVEVFLCKACERWPEKCRAVIGDRLRQWADEHCG